MTIEDKANELEDLVNLAAIYAAKGLNSCVYRCATSNDRKLYDPQIINEESRLFVELKVPAHIFAGRVADHGREFDYQTLAYGVCDRNFKNMYNSEYKRYTPDIDGIYPSELIDTQIEYAGPNIPAYFKFTFRGERV